MIKYNLKCANNHEFESWFADSKEFEKLNDKRLLECIYCSSKKIKKSIMAPRISGVKSTEDNLNFLNQKMSLEKNKLIRLRNYVEKNFEYVGNNFSKKVREVYYDKKSKKSIYGSATSEERKELEEEGIDLLSIPWVSKDN
tara:strand:- start:2228 stop:2650 length:423 start_codon:yes stop_codon:yes gene_type:complete